MLMGHQDVVPASDEGWSVGAYSGTVKDGCLYGRGALDCKSTMYVQLQAVEELLSEGFTPPCDVYLEYSINEETGGDGAAAAIVQQNLSETHAVNDVTSIVFDFRGYDTMGEAFILCTAVAGSIVILYSVKKEKKEEDTDE